jgi:hypothetical protein
MEPVVAVFILDEKCNGQCTGQAYRQAGNIDQRICLALKQISPGDFEVASEHGKEISSELLISAFTNGYMTLVISLLSICRIGCHFNRTSGDTRILYKSRIKRFDMAASGLLL